ncbi:15728_t:CDS:2, partial [Cetraspora pellucida]
MKIITSNEITIFQNRTVIKKWKAKVISKDRCPKAAIWEDFDLEESDGKSHYGAKYEQNREFDKALLKAFVSEG